MQETEWGELFLLAIFVFFSFIMVKNHPVLTAIVMCIRVKTTRIDRFCIRQH